MPEPMIRRSDIFDALHRKRMRVGLGIAVLLHILVLFMFQNRLPLPESPFSAAGQRAFDDRAAQGGGSQIIAMRVAEEVQPIPETETEPEPIPIPVPEPRPEIRIPDPKPSIATAPVVAVGVVTEAVGRGTSTGPGTETGTGAGDAGTGEEGLFRVVPPTPRGLILPPSDRPGRVRGMEIDIWVFVSEAGAVVADSTRLSPTTGDRGFDRRLREQAAEWVFTPAQRDGAAVAEWFRYTIIL